MIDGLAILVVEDDTDILRMVATILESAGARVTTARTGRDGVEIAGRERLDAIIVDWNLGDMPGGACLPALATACPELRGRTLVMTGELMRTPDEHAAGAAGYPVLTKPFRPTELRAALARLVA